MEIQVEHDVDGRRFCAKVEGHLCVLDYRLADGVMTITHTGVPEEVGGRGVASELMKAALAVARAEGWKVIPACPYAAAFMRRHPEYDGLRFRS